MIDVQELRFAYDVGSFRLGVDCFQVAKGESAAITGPSGSGKTTLLHLVAGILAPQAGRIRVDAVEASDLTEAGRRAFRIRRLGLVFQDFALIDYLSVVDNILLPYWMEPSLTMSSDVRARALRLAEAMQLADLVERRPDRLSQGERQRVAVCRALAASPSVVLADEPTANLDRGNAVRVVQALTEYAASNNAAVVLATHDLEAAQACSRRIDWRELTNDGVAAGEEEDLLGR